MAITYLTPKIKWYQQPAGNIVELGSPIYYFMQRDFWAYGRENKFVCCAKTDKICCHQRGRIKIICRHAYLDRQFTLPMIAILLGCQIMHSNDCRPYAHHKSILQIETTCSFCEY
jgi:hypothetical protein